jgi:predicted AlkP superfamily pyrophosphatase or phosphodiesterase
MRKVAVIDVVGLSKSVIGPNTPFIADRASKGISNITPTIPAVTCTTQSTYLTGEPIQNHGIVANGWLFRDEMEIKLWRQSNKLVAGEKIWETAKKLNPEFTSANLFWWYNMNTKADYSVTPRPQYKANGRKIPDCYSQPSELRDELQNKLGTFPLFNFWGPMTSIKSSEWIAESAKFVFEKHNPTLSLVYLPHLDYCLQKFDHSSKEVSNDLNQIDNLVKDLTIWFEERDVEVILLSEYGINPVTSDIPINRILRNAGYIAVRDEDGEILDPGQSKAFALADHQFAHVYVQDHSKIEELKKLLTATDGIQEVWDKEEQQKQGISHERSGELICISKPDRWFSYYYWLNENNAPDFAQMVDIHKKPGYDPVEMFLKDGALVKPSIALKLIGRKLGLNTVMDVISTDTTKVKGSHGSPFVSEEYHPVLISKDIVSKNIEATSIKQFILDKIFES